MLLLDEPLGALDLKLREQMQEELKALQKQLGITFVFVTHDQGEALSMADRVAIFNDGKIVQVGAPADVYERPAVALRRRLRRLVECAVARVRLAPRRTAEMDQPQAREDRRLPGGTNARRGQSHADGEITVDQLSGRRHPLQRRARATRGSPPTMPAGATSFKQGDKVRLIWPKSAMVTMEDGA